MSRDRTGAATTYLLLAVDPGVDPITVDLVVMQERDAWTVFEHHSRSVGPAVGRGYLVSLGVEDVECACRTTLELVDLPASVPDT